MYHASPCQSSADTSLASLETPDNGEKVEGNARTCWKVFYDKIFVPIGTVLVIVLALCFLPLLLCWKGLCWMSKNKKRSLLILGIIMIAFWISTATYFGIEHGFETPSSLSWLYPWNWV